MPTSWFEVSELDAKFHIGGKIAVAQSMLKMGNVGKSWKNGWLKCIKDLMLLVKFG